jgi:hypothetical protein
MIVETFEVTLADVRFSNRPFGVKRFQTIHHHSSMSLRGSCFSSESPPGPLYGAFLVKKFKRGSASFFFHQFRCSI